MADIFGDDAAPNPDDLLVEHYRRTAKTLRMAEDAKALHSAAMKRATDSGVDGEMLKFMHKASRLPSVQVHDDIRRAVRACGFLGIPMVQEEMFAIWQQPGAETMSAIDCAQAEETGHNAVRSGLPRDVNPYEPGSAAYAACDRAWLDATDAQGKAILAMGAEAAGPGDDMTAMRKAVADMLLHGEGSHTDASGTVVKLSAERRPRVAKATHPEGGRA